MAEKFGTNVYAPVVAGNDTNDDMAVAYGDELGRTIHKFKTIADRDAFTAKYKSRLFDSWCMVKEGSAHYEWTGTQEDGSDGQWQEIDMGGATAPSLTIGQQWGNYDTVDNLTELNTLYPLEINQGMSGPNQPSPGVAVLSIKPGEYEGAHSPAFLGKVGSLTEVKDGHDTTIFYNSPITPYGMYFSANKQLEGINIQESDNLDPNLGGQLTELLVSLGFEGGAPKDGTVKLWLMYHQNGAQLPDGYLTDTRGKPMIIEKSFIAGEKVKLILDGAYYAKALETITVHVEHNFADEYMIVNPEESLFCINQYEHQKGSSISRIEFMRRNGIQITPAFFDFHGDFANLQEFTYQTSEPESEINPGEGENYIAQFGINNLTKVKASITDGAIKISDNGTDIADFYLDYLVDNTRTSMMRGKTFSATFTGNSRDSSFNLAMYAWNGNADEPSQIYSSRNNNIPTLNTGWSKVGEVFIAEDATGTNKTVRGEFTIPETANNVAFAIVPTVSQLPLSLSIDGFRIAPVSNFIGYLAIEKTNLRDIHLDTSDEYLELGQNCEGYASLRYTINYSPVNGLPMPVGVPLKGNAPFTLDKTKNVIAGSSATGGEGALVAGKDGQVSLSCDYMLWNETSTDTVVDIWWVLYDVDGNESKIAASQVQYTIPANSTTHSIPKTQKAFVFEIEKGQAFALRASANKPDGAYIESDKLTDYMVRPVIDFKELVAQGADDPDLVSAPLNKKLVVDRREYEFSGNSSQNIEISVEIPADVELANIEVVKHFGTTTTSVREAEYSYDSATGILTVHVGPSVAEGRVYLEFWG